MLDAILKFLCSKEVYGTIIIIFITFILYRIVYAIIDRTNIRGKDELEKKRRTTIIMLFKNIAKYVLIILMVIALLSLYGFNITSLLAGIGVAGAVVGFALQDALKDIINGIAIIFDNYFVVGDIVEFEGFMGTIVEFGLKSTKIKKLSGETLIISNRDINRITNISKERATVIIEVPTAYEEKYENVEKVLLEVLELLKNNYNEVSETEYFGIEKFSESCILYSVAITCRRGTQWRIKRIALKEIKLAYEKNHIKIPYNQLEVHNGHKI